MKTVCIIQARMGSTRLPGKVLMDVGGEAMLAQVVHRCLRAQTLDTVAVAMTTQPEDDVLADFCAQRGWPCERGSADDVLDRYVQTARRLGAEVVVRVTSDCPLIEPDVIDGVVQTLGETGADYASNTLPPRTFPRGLDVEALTRDALERAGREDRDPAWREHVTPYVYRHPELFGLAAVVNATDHSNERWTVDTPEDLAFARTVYAHFTPRPFGWRDVLAALDVHPEWRDLNRHVPQKAV